jgi:hypothetical protein
MLRLRILAATAAFAALSGAPDAARAQDAAYCAYAGGRGSYENCGYYTLRQCMEAVSGVGGACRPNPRYRYSSPPGYYDESPPPRRRVVRPQ